MRFEERANCPRVFCPYMPRGPTNTHEVKVDWEYVSRPAEYGSPLKLRHFTWTFMNSHCSLPPSSSDWEKSAGEVLRSLGNFQHHSTDLRNYNNRVFCLEF
jgi:hypothetical protein